jgi:hypothetical protein
MCYVYGEVRITSLASGCLFHYFLKPLYMCAGGFALPSSVFCAGEELRYLFLQCKATTRRDLTLKSLQLTLPTRVISSLTLICVSRHVLCNISQRMGILGPLLNRKSDLSVRNGVLLYKQLIRPMMDYACPAWRSASRTHVRRLQVLQSKCLRLATGAPWYVSNRQIHKDLGVPLFADHIRALTASLDSKLADVRNPPSTETRQIRWPRVDPVAWRESQGRQGPAGQSRPSPAMAKSTK